MTHDEAMDALPAYALGAFDGDNAALEAHVANCDDCSRQLADFLEATGRLGAAVPLLGPPPRLRAAVLAAAPVRRAAWSRQWRLVHGASRLLPLAATVVLGLGLTGYAVVQHRQVQADRLALATDERGLALLTSTETTVERLAPVGSLGDQAHGHWYHRPGIATQVVVVEFMPPPPAGQAYYGWLVLANGGIQPIGRFTLDATGYGRIILPGADGTNVRAVEVTRRPTTSVASPGQVVLRWPGS